MKKIITLLLSIAVLFTTMLPIYAESASVSVSVSPSTAHPGDTVTVTVTVTGTPAAKNISISSSYDSGLLSLAGGSNSNSASSGDPKNWGGSRISYSLTIRSDAPITSTTISGSCSVSDPESASGSDSATLTILCNHDFSSKAENKYLAANATCEHPALYYYYCSKCGESEGNSSHVYEVGDKLSHVFDAQVESEKHLATAGDCKTHPTYYYSCSLCGTNDTTRTFESANFGDHKYVNTATSKYLVSNATCTKKATYYSHCSICNSKGDTFESGSTLEHKYGDFIELDEKYHAHTCSSCGSQEKEKHVWDEGITKKKATETEKGEILYTCKVCGAEKIEEIKKVNTKEIEIPKIDISTREYFYTGSEIEFVVPESDYYTVSGNKQVNAGEYDVTLSLTKAGYSWEDGSKDDVIYKFIIQKSDYDMSGVEFLDGAGIGDGIHGYSLQAINLPEGVSVTYNRSDEKEVGSHKVIASFVGDDNHNEIPNMQAILYILEKPSEINRIHTTNGSASGYLPVKLNFTITNLDPTNIIYIDAKNEVENSFDVVDEKILGVCDLSFDYSGLVVQPYDTVNVNMQIPDTIKDHFKLYHVHTNDEGNKLCEEVKYKTEDDGSISFTLNDFSQIVFVKAFNFKVLIPFIIGIDVLVVIGFVIFALSKKKKKENTVENAESEPIKKESFLTKLINNIKENIAKRKEKNRLAKEEKLAKKKEKEEEAARLVEEKRLAEEEAARLAEEERIAAEKAKAEEEARLAEEARIAEEKRLAEEEAARIAEEKRLAEEEAARLAEEARIAEEKRLAEEEAQKALENSLKVEETENEQIIIDDDLEEEVPEVVKVKKESFITKLLNKIKDNKAKKKEKAELAKAAKEAARKEKEKKISDIKATSIYKIEDISDDDD